MRLFAEAVVQQTGEKIAGRRVFAGLILLLLLAGGAELATGAEAETVEQRYLAGLRERRLFTLADAYCERRLSDPQLPADERGLLTLEWIRTVSESAAHAPADRRAELWERADQIATDFLRKNPGHPQALLIHTQQALSVLAHGELQRLEAEVAADPAVALSGARDTLRRAHKSLEAVASNVTTAVHVVQRVNPSAEQLTAVELTSLLHNIRFYLARALQNQAQSYPDGSSDRIAALTQAVEQLASLQREIPADDPLGRQIQLELAICRRLLKDRDLNEETWKSLDAAGVPAPLRLAARAEQARWELNQNRPQQAVQVLSAGRELNGTTSAELDLAHLETFLALWQAAAASQQPVAAKKWEDQALKTVELIEQSHGAYWGRRADLLLVRVGEGRSSGGAELLRRTADNFVRKGELDEALVAYDKAAEAARAENDLQSAFELAYKGALVEQHRARHEQAAGRFRKLALADSRQPQADNAHLLAIANVARLWPADDTRGDLYRELLEEHLATWPQSPTADAARLWLGGYREREQDWEPALLAYRQVRPDSEHFREAVLAVERCLSAWLPVRQAGGERVDTVALDFAGWLEAAVLGPDRQPPDMWNATQRTACLVAARLRLAWTIDRRGEIEQQLRWALDGSPPPTAEWAAEARLQLVVAIASQPGRASDALQLLTQTPLEDRDQWFAMTSRLAEVVATASADTRPALARLALAALDRLPSVGGELPQDMVRQATRLRATALAAAGDHQAAIDCLTRLARQLPRDGDVQAALGDMLLTSSNPSDWRLALDQWRIVAAHSQPRSALWFRAKYAVALAQFQLGEKGEAAKLIRYLQATENLADSGMEQQFAELLRRCAGP